MAAQSTPQGSSYSAPPMGGLPPTVAATPPGSTPPASYTPAPPYGSGLNNDAPPLPFTGYGNDMVPPPPMPTDPYAMGGMVSPQFQPPKKKTSPWLVIGIVVLALIVVAGGGGLLIALASHGGQTNNGNGGGGGLLGGNGGGNFAASQNLSNLSVTYANVSITFKSVQQAQKFPDDNLATDNFLHKYFVRMNIHETNNEAQNSEVFYDEAFHLTLPDGTTVNAINSQQDTGPGQGENRDNWVDFGTNGQVDLSKLTLTIGQSSEQQVKVPLQSGANLSAYQPKTINPNQQFQYAGFGWVLKDATESLSFGGQQAKTGKVFVIVDVIANNNSQIDFTSDGTSFVTLHSGSTSTAPDILGSNVDNFISIQSGNTNVTGTWEFSTPQSPDGQYSLVFAASDANSQIPFSGQTVNFTIN